MSLTFMRAGENGIQHQKKDSQLSSLLACIDRIQHLILTNLESHYLILEGIMHQNRVVSLRTG